jgi:hypothetical protein
VSPSIVFLGGLRQVRFAKAHAAIPEEVSKSRCRKEFYNRPRSFVLCLRLFLVRQLVEGSED